MKQLTAEQKATQHTSGWYSDPPITEPGPTFGDVIIRCNEHYAIARVLAGDAIINGPYSPSNLPGDYSAAKSERESNAMLITAAPELLAALQRLIADHLVTEGDGYKQAVDAINKATGKA